MTLIWSGVSLGAVYALVAFGYNIVYIASKTFNFAQAQLMMVGAFIAYTGLVTWTLPSVIVAIIATVAVFVIAAIEEIVAIRPLRDMHNALVTTLGASILLTGLTQLIWGNQPLTVPFFGGDEVLTVLGGQVVPGRTRAHRGHVRAGRRVRSDLEADHGRTGADGHRRGPRGGHAARSQRQDRRLPRLRLRRCGGRFRRDLHGAQDLCGGHPRVQRWP